MRKSSDTKMEIVFRPALPEDSELLSKIAISSKGHWGYPQNLLDLWKEKLQVTPEYIAKNCLRIILQDSNVVGFFAIVKGDPAMLDHLWLLPEAIGKGIGKLALEEAKQLALSAEVTQLTIISDPHAEAFYLHCGAIRIGEHPSKPQNRMLPKLLLNTQVD